MHREQRGGRDRSRRTWLRPMATLFFSRSSAWKSSSIACGEGAHRGIAQKTFTPWYETAETGRRDPRCLRAPSKGASSLWAPSKGASSCALASSSPCKSTPTQPESSLRNGCPSPESWCQKDFLPRRLLAGWGGEICSCMQDFPPFAAIPGLEGPRRTGGCGRRLVRKARARPGTVQPGSNCAVQLRALGAPRLPGSPTAQPMEPKAGGKAPSSPPSPPAQS